VHVMYLLCTYILTYTIGFVNYFFA
jgi:hypothetical protein